MQGCLARNASRFRAALQFVVGDGDSVDQARALELIHSHPDVFRMVREIAAVTRSETRERIANGSSRVRLCSLNDFMKLAGVVRKKVQCLDHQLNAYCLLPIRSFLSIDDCVDV
ncbi:hypothetical protein MTO96_041872 [Rhipicephalus appendiculatus]